MEISNKKKSLPAPIRIVLLCVQHLCAAFMVVVLVNIILSIGIVGKGVHGGSDYYSLNPFEKANSFVESSTFYDIFQGYTRKAVLDTVISAQFGTTGEIDGSTDIDIVEYANRKNGLIENSKLSLTYKLDDLLKWGLYGFSYEAVNIENLEDVFTFFPEMEKQYSDLTYMKAFELLYTAAAENGIQFNTYFTNTEEHSAIALFLPIERYKPTEGTSMKACADNLFDYFYLIEQLECTVKDLSINFDTYQSIHNDLDMDKTNFRYCIELYGEKEEVYRFTNFDLKSDSLDYLTKNSGPVYFIWNRNSIAYDTNMPSEMYEVISDIFVEYEYALGENVKVYLSVDGNFQSPDAFKMGLEKFAVAKDIWLYISLAILCAIIWIVLFLYLSVMTGRKKVDGNTQIVLRWFDYVPTEIAATIAGLVGVLIFYVYLEVKESFGDFMSWYTYENDEQMILGFAIVAGALSVLFTFFWYSMLRRFKARTIFKHSIICRFLIWIYKGIKKVVCAVKVQIQYIYNNSSDASKVIWPAILLMLLHFIVVPVGGVLVVEGFDYGNGELILGLFVYGVLFVIDAFVAMAVLKNKVNRTEIVRHIERIAQGEMDIRLKEEDYKGENLKLAQSVNNIGNGIKTAVETSMKDERMKADLITNVSHDIKTPLTSIINYVDLLKREQIETEPVKGYIEVLDAKSQRLKQLTDDLVEASKISSGNIVLHMERINLAELLKQSVGEFSEKFESKRLTIVENYGEGEHLIYADPRRMWRVIENLFNNVYKYALEGTRVYVDITLNEFGEKKQVLLSIKNISSTQLNIRPDELTERFVRGDDSRTTEGSGLGLSIAKSLVVAQGGNLNIILDGDLFKIVILFDESIQNPLN